VSVPDCVVTTPGDDIAGANGAPPVAGALPLPPHPAKRSVLAKSAEIESRRLVLRRILVPVFAVDAD
jgi:hypothetical protein